MNEGSQSKTVRTASFKDTLFEILAKHDGRALNLMICGGSLLSVLDNPSYKTLNTSKWRIFYADERCNLDYLNYDESLQFLSYLDSKNYPIPVELGKEVAIKKYREILGSGMLRTNARHFIDICLLGIGDNGHICSLWPESDDLHAREDFIGVTVDCPFSPDRATITIKFINREVGDLYFVIPPKNGAPKKVSEPHPSIWELITRPSTTLLPE